MVPSVLLLTVLEVLFSFLRVCIYEENRIKLPYVIVYVVELHVNRINEVFEVMELTNHPIRYHVLFV